MTAGSGLAKTLNAKYGNWLDIMVVNAQGGQGAISLKVRGIFTSGIKDYDDTAMKVPLTTAQRLMGTEGVSKVLILRLIKMILVIAIVVLTISSCTSTLAT